MEVSAAGDAVILIILNRDFFFFCSTRLGSLFAEQSTIQLPLGRPHLFCLLMFHSLSQNYLRYFELS